MDELPPHDAFGTLIFQVAGQQLSVSTDGEVEAAPTAVPGIGPWMARGFLLVGLDRPELSDRRRPYRSLAVSYLFASEYDV